MPDPDDRLTAADSRDLAKAIAFALRYRCRKRVHQAVLSFSSIEATSAA